MVSHARGYKCVGVEIFPIQTEKLREMRKKNIKEQKKKLRASQNSSQSRQRSLSKSSTKDKKIVYNYNEPIDPYNKAYQSIRGSDSPSAPQFIPLRSLTKAKSLKHFDTEDTTSRSSQSQLHKSTASNSSKFNHTQSSIHDRSKNIGGDGLRKSLFATSSTFT